MTGCFMGPRVDRVLVGVDGSHDARRALEWAIAVAWAFDAELVAVHAAGLLAHIDEGPPVPSQAHLGELRTRFEHDWCEPLAQSPVAHRFLMPEGPPVLALLETAEREEVDLIVVGQRGLGGVAELLGSTSLQLAERSHRPLLIVPPGT